MCIYCSLGVEWVGGSGSEILTRHCPPRRLRNHCHTSARSLPHVSFLMKYTLIQQRLLSPRCPKLKQRCKFINCCLIKGTNVQKRSLHCSVNYKPLYNWENRKQFSGSWCGERCIVPLAVTLKDWTSLLAVNKNWRLTRQISWHQHIYFSFLDFISLTLTTSSLLWMLELWR